MKKKRSLLFFSILETLTPASAPLSPRFFVNFRLSCALLFCTDAGSGFPLRLQVEASRPIRPPSATIVTCPYKGQVTILTETGEAIQTVQSGGSYGTSSGR